MAKEAKFNFIEEGLLGKTQKNTGFYVNVLKSGTLYFPRDYVDIYELRNAYLKIYADTAAKTIGWKIFKAGTVDAMKGLRKLSINPKTGTGLISIHKLLTVCGYDKKSFEKVSGHKIVQLYKSSYFDGEMSYIKLIIK